MSMLIGSGLIQHQGGAPALSLPWDYRALETSELRLTEDLIQRVVEDGGPPVGYNLIWEDDFDTLSLGGPADGQNWVYYYGLWNVRFLEGNSDDFYKTRDTEAVAGGGTVSSHLQNSGLWGEPPYLHRLTGNSSLLLQTFPRPDSVVPGGSGTPAEKPYWASMIENRLAHSRTYGYFEAKLRFPKLENGHHFGFWMVRADGSWPPEIDIGEVAMGTNKTPVAENGDYVVQTAIDVGSPYTIVHQTFSALSDWAIPPSPAFVEGHWMRWGFLWTPGSMTWLINGEPRVSIANYVNSPMYLLLTWEGASNYPGDPDAETSWPGQAEIDYVRIYAEA